MARIAPSLPQELQDEIISLLHADRPTLHRCALVCCARRHLFARLALSPFPGPRRQALVALHGPCRHRHPPRGPRRRTLRTRFAMWWRPQAGGAQESYIAWPVLAGAWLQRAFGAAAGHGVSDWDVNSDSSPLGSCDVVVLSNVTTLRLSELTFYARFSAALACPFPSVDTLTFHGCRAMSFADSDFARLLRAFPRLTSLRLYSVEWLATAPQHGKFGPVHDGGSGGGYGDQETSEPAKRCSPVPKIASLEVSRDIFLERVTEW
ncbi:hypothetical protein C8Q79DRAFT_924555 [Trametes meyenii]|nr:hypothetical protein C8Q79DRAFT_924555 [Trametes meyenii]